MAQKQPATTEIVNRGAPHVSVRKLISATIACPNCSASMNLDANDVDIGHVVKCGTCKKHTYYPFEQPWYRRRKLVLGYVVSLVITFLVGLAVNFTSERLKAPEATHDETNKAK